MNLPIEARKIELLRSLVLINSGTQNVDGVNQVQDIVARELKKLGFEVTEEFHPEGSSKAGRFLIGTLRRTDGPFVSLVTHADTVFEAESGFLDFKINEKKGTATGPGVIDDKGGIVVALAGLEAFLKKDLPLNLRLICTPSEEIGSPGFHPLLKRLGEESSIVLGFEPSMEDGSIIKSRGGNRWYHIHVRGQEAHAGRDPKRGIDAAFELAHKLVELYRLTDYKKNVTVSVGQINGGSKFNIVCGHAEAKVDARFSDFESRDRLHRKIERIFRRVFTKNGKKNSEGKRASCTWDIVDDCPPFAEFKQSAPFLKRYREIVKKIERRPIQVVRSGGSADANYMSHASLIVVDGLGATGGGMHRPDEFVRLESLETRAQALSEFLAYIAQEARSLTRS